MYTDTLNPKILQLLNRRGITTEEEMEEFFSDTPQESYDPRFLNDIEKGTEIILDAIDRHEKICIYGDYDVDGITSTVILHDMLSNLTDNLTYYIPSRFEEGYGLNKNAVKKIKEDGCDLIITVDCGCTSVEEVEYAKGLGMRIVVTDHHTMSPDTIPDCPVVNPKYPGKEYPCPHIAGCGVAFKVTQLIAQKKGMGKASYLKGLDLLAIGTVSDIVPLVSENRTFVKYGLRLIKEGHRQTLRRMIHKMDLDYREITSENISFVIAPRLNAAGRLKHAKYAVEMFLSDEDEIIEDRIDMLLALNELRKELQDEIFERCKEIVERDMTGDRFLVLKLKDAHEGVTGIVAGRLRETYWKPVIILTETDEGLLKGTGRSVEDVNLYEELSKNKDLFEKFGGHAAACGLTMKGENYKELRKRLNEQMEAYDADVFTEKVHIDINLDPQEISKEMLKQIEMFEPCGKDNEKPAVSINGTIQKARRIGSNNQYLKFEIRLNDNSVLSAVSFGNVEKIEKHKDKKGNIVGNLSLNIWRDREEMQLKADNVV